MRIGVYRRPGLSLFTAYFLLFLTFLAPLHSIEHLSGSCSDGRTIDDTSLATSIWHHDQDRCQLCRTGGQLEFLPTSYATQLHAAVTGTLPVVAPVLLKDTPATPSSPRSPPTRFAI